jgi:hypothetical protein
VPFFVTIGSLSRRVFTVAVSFERDRKATQFFSLPLQEWSDASGLSRPFALAVGFFASNVQAADTPREIKGLYLMTDYPAVTVRPGTTSNIPLHPARHNAQGACDMISCSELGAET